MKLKFFQPLIFILVVFFILVLPGRADANVCDGSAQGATTFACPGTPTRFICGTPPNLQCSSGSIPVLGANQEYNCFNTSCPITCVSEYADCTSASGCETVVQSGSCNGGAGTWTGDSCSRVCSPNPRPSVTLAPTSVQEDDQSNPSIWINKTGAGDMLKLQGAGVDKFVVNNSGQLVMGLGWTHNMVDGQNLIYGGLDYRSAGNVLLFQKQRSPTETVDLTLLQLDNFGNLTVGNNLIVNGLLQLSKLSADPDATATGSLYYNRDTNKIRVKYGSGWGDIGGGTTYTPGDYISFGPAPANAISAKDNDGCFGPVFKQKSINSFQGNINGPTDYGYVNANRKCPSNMHICTANELLNSINCDTLSRVTVSDEPKMWVSNGIPSLPAPTNDCDGWTKNASGWQGVIWEYNAGGGKFFAASCNESYQFACCK